MSVRTSTELSPELREAQALVRQRAVEYGLDFFETIFEVLDFNTMNQLAAYGGFPVRYPHWHWGMEYEKLRKRDAYGLGRIYEMVINNDPCYAYLQESNSVTEQTLVMAHVYGHCDFFKCNAWFGKTDRHMMDQTANHATRVLKHSERHGSEAVERFLDTCLSIEHLIDPYSPYLKREDSPEFRPLSRDEKRGEDEWSPQRLPAKDYMERFVNPPAVMRAEQREHDEQERAARLKFPAHPTRDVLMFLMRHAPLTDWQRDVLSIIRDESYYFAPQAMTKIMNEGWATYWHSKIMTTHMLQSSEIIDYADQHSGVVYMGPGGFNPYKIGLEVWKDIERRWDRGQHGSKWESLGGLGEREAFDDGTRVGREKIFEVRRIYNDVTFIDEFLSDELIERMRMYIYKRDPRTGQMVIASRDPHVIRQNLIYRLSNMGQPYVYVVDANYCNRGELYLAHQFNGLEIEAAKAVEVLRAIQRLWGRPVHLQMRLNEEMCLVTCKGPEEDDLKREKISESVPRPAHVVA